MPKEQSSSRPAAPRTLDRLAPALAPGDGVPQPLCLGTEVCPGRPVTSPLLSAAAGGAGTRAPGASKDLAALPNPQSEGGGPGPASQGAASPERPKERQHLLPQVGSAQGNRTSRRRGAVAHSVRCPPPSLKRPRIE